MICDLFLDENIFVAIRRILLRNYTDIYGPQRMNPNDLCDPLT